MSGDEQKRGIRILVLEGAGAKGLSQLTVLGEIMSRVQEEEGLDDIPDIHEWFEFIVGVDTAAMIAALVGRMRMSIEDVTGHFKRLGVQVFAKKKTIGTSVGSTDYTTTKLLQTLKDIVQDASESENEMMMDTDPDPRCRTCGCMIFAMSKHNMNAGIPTIFRSYRAPANQFPDCAIWEAVAASMAHPAHFKSIDVGEPPLQESFVAGSVGCSNPTLHALEEIKRVCPGRHVACILVIGAGHARTIHIPESTTFQRILSTRDPNEVGMSLAMDAERVAHEAAVRFRSMTHFYFRLSVEQGMQNISHDDWDQLNKVLSHTRAYMRQNEVNVTINSIVRAMRERATVVPVTHIDGELQSLSGFQSYSVKICPSPSPVFTGRRDTIDQIVACISRGDQRRCMFVLYGLGGAGKTQLALKTVAQTMNMWTDVVFVDATSHETAKGALAVFAREKKIGHTYESALKWLGSQRERWLMLIDNADDPSVDVKEYIPTGDTGSILMTIRIEQYALLSQGDDSDYRVTGMKQEEAMRLLLKTARIREDSLSDTDSAEANRLLESLGYLALAIVQAGAYIFASKRSIAQYNSMLIQHRKDTLEAYSRLPARVDNYRKSVYTTWYMSYILLSNKVQRLLHLMAFMHHSGISEDTFRRAAIKLKTYVPTIPATDAETKIQTYVVECLQPYLNSAGTWDSILFLESMTELLSYSLISYDRAKSAYTLHVLVHDWASTVIEQPLEVAIDHTALLLAMSIDYDDTTESLEYDRKVDVHVTRLLDRQEQPSANNAVLFAEVYYRTAKWKLKERMEQIVLDGRQRALSMEDSATVTIMNNLAFTYREQGRYNEAARLLNQVIEIGKRVSGHEHRNTLVAMRNLVQTYWTLGRYNDAESLAVQILETTKRIYGSNHPDTFWSTHDLALTYSHQGRYAEAEVLLLEVVDAMKRVKGSDHPNTLNSMYVLASTYYHQQRYDEAESMLKHVLEAIKRTQGDEHPHTLNVMDNLALVYQAKGRGEDAEALQVKVLNARKHLYGTDHPDTLNCMLCLATTYHSQGRYELAAELGKQAVEGQKSVLGTTHPLTLLSMRRLLATYKAMGESRQREYEALDLQITTETAA